MTKPNPRTLLLLAAVAGMTVAGCSRSEPEQPPETNLSIEEEAPTPEPTVETIAPVTEPTVDANDSLPLPPPEKEEPDEQMLDDASATGMTARSSRDDEDREQPANYSN